MHCCSKLLGMEIQRQDMDEVKALLAYHVAVEHAIVRYYYAKPSLIQSLIYGLKYHHCMEYADFFGERLATQLLKTFWWRDIDVIIPVPLHPIRKWERGYNQCELIAEVVAEKLHIPMEKRVVKRKHYNRQQAKKDALQRKKVDEAMFGLTRMGDLKGKHVLLLDDLITTGTTMAECALALTSVPGIRISICAVAMPTP